MGVEFKSYLRAADLLLCYRFALLCAPTRARGDRRPSPSPLVTRSWLLPVELERRRRTVTSAGRPNRKRRFLETSWRGSSRGLRGSRILNRSLDDIVE